MPDMSSSRYPVTDLPGLRRPVTEDAWRIHAACRGLDPNLFVPDYNEGFTDEARLLCQLCTVTVECLDWVLDNVPAQEDQGLYAGTSRRVRLRLRKQRNQ